MKRVVYRNPLDGLKRVFIGNLDDATADAVMAKWGNPNEPLFYMGDETRIEPCDGTPDGQVIEEVAS